MPNQTIDHEKWILFKEQMDQVLEMKGEFYSQPHSLVSVGEAYLSQNRRNYCLEQGNPVLFLSYPQDQVNEMASRLISMAIKREWEQRIGGKDRFEEIVIQKVLIGIYGEGEVKWLNQMGYQESGSYLTIVVRIWNEINSENLNLVEEVLRSYLGFPLHLIKSGEYYACFLPVTHITTDDSADSPNWKEIGQGIYELLVTELNLETSVAFFRTSQGIRSWGTSFRSGARVLQVGMEMYPEKHIFFAWEMDLEVLLYQIPQEGAQSFQMAVLGGRGKDYMNQEWFHMIRTLIQENLNISETARKMYVHRNTITYRLEKFKLETGRDLRMMEDAIQVYLATLLNRVEMSAAKREK